jgi:hypothetical protein
VDGAALNGGDVRKPPGFSAFTMSYTFFFDLSTERHLLNDGFICSYTDKIHDPFENRSKPESGHIVRSSPSSWPLTGLTIVTSYLRGKLERCVLLPGSWFRVEREPCSNVVGQSGVVACCSCRRKCQLGYALGSGPPLQGQVTATSIGTHAFRF